MVVPLGEALHVDEKLDLLFDGPASAQRTIVLAHGAGVGMDAPFMSYFAAGLGTRDFRVARFEFPYMAASRRTGQRRQPDREPVLRATWLKVVDMLGREGLVIGGKSLGGRIASLVADEAGVAGLVCLGYPFHPVGNPERLRVEHLRTIQTPTLIVQGEQDAFGSRQEVAGYSLSSAVRVHWIEDGDHDLKQKAARGSEERSWEAALGEIVTFLASLSEPQAGRS
jgi:predicted alpha/beta-hydrolase family hydrolase